MEEQRKRKALMTCHERQAMAEFEEAISQIVGLQELKMQLRRWARGMLFDEKRRAMGLGIATRRAPHMAFLGNPGTGNNLYRSYFSYYQNPFQFSASFIFIILGCLGTFIIAMP
jgi:hypothetical protein